MTLSHLSQYLPACYSHLNLFLLLIIIGPSYSVLRALFSPLRRLPGPFVARFTRLWYAYQLYRGDFEQTNIELHRKYGPIVRLTPNEYSIDGNPDDIKTIYGQRTTFIKSKSYTTWMPPHLPAGFFSDVDPVRHGIQRRKFTSLYSVSSVVTYEQYVDTCTRLLTNLIDKAISSSSSPGKGAVIPLGRWAQCFAFDVIGSVTFGHRFGLLETGVDTEGIFNEIEKRTTYPAFMGLWPWAHKYVYPVIARLGGGYSYVTSFTLRMKADREKEIKDRAAEGKAEDGPPDFMTKLLERHKEDPEKITQYDLFTACQANIGAGSDTTSIALSSVFYYLCHPQDNGRSMAKLRKEIDEADTRGELSNPITFKESQRLHYLQCVLKEAIRLHPVAGSPLSREVTEDTVIHGVLFPKGTDVGISAWVSNRNKGIIGEDADEWWPERWADETKSREMERNNMSWGMGSRACIGKGLAMLEIEKLVPELIRRYDFHLEEGLKKRVENGERWTTRNRVFVKMVGFEVLVKRRETTTAE